MTAALRYILIGTLCASITALWQPAWYVTLIAFWAGMCFGLLISLSAAVFDRLTGASK